MLSTVDTTVRPKYTVVYVCVCFLVLCTGPSDVVTHFVLVFFNSFFTIFLQLCNVFGTIIVLLFFSTCFCSFFFNVSCTLSFCFFLCTGNRFFSLFLRSGVEIVFFTCSGSPWWPAVLRTPASIFNYYIFHFFFCDPSTQGVCWSAVVRTTASKNYFIFIFNFPSTQGACDGQQWYWQLHQDVGLWFSRRYGSTAEE